MEKMNDYLLTVLLQLTVVVLLLKEEFREKGAKWRISMSAAIEPSYLVAANLHVN